MPKISIIVPVYNVEKYLEKSLNSLVNQTLKDIEIILVDDGSTDSSLEICKKYAEKDNRIVIIPQQNQGPSVARNNALKIAKGEFIGFVDSDDYIENDTYEKALSNMTDDVDMVVWGVKVISDDNLGYVEWFQNYFNVEYNGIQELSEEIRFSVSVVPWNKLYRKSIIEEKEIDFPAGRLYEDNAFWWKYTMWCKKAYFMPEQLHYYNMRISSLRGEVINTKKDKEADRIYMVENVYDFCKKHNILSENKALMEKLFINSFSDAYQESGQKEKLVIQANQLAKKMKLQKSQNKELQELIKELTKTNNKYENNKKETTLPSYKGVNQAIKEIKKRINANKKENDVRIKINNILGSSKLLNDIIDDYFEKKDLTDEIAYLKDFYKYVEPSKTMPYTTDMYELMMDFLNKMYRKGLSDEIIKFANIFLILYPENFELNRIKGDAYYFLKKEPLKAFYYYNLYTNFIKNNESVYIVMSDICGQEGDIFHQLMYKQIALNAKYH